VDSDKKVDSSEDCKIPPLEKSRELLNRVCRRPWEVNNVREPGHDKLTIREGDKFRFGFDRKDNLSVILHKKTTRSFYNLVDLDSHQYTPIWFSMDRDNIVVIHCYLSSTRHELIFTFNLGDSTFEYLVGEDGQQSNHGRGGGN